MFDLEILFNNLIESFYLSIGLKMKSRRKFAVYFKFYCEYYEELKDKNRTFIYDKFV